MFRHLLRQGCHGQEKVREKRKFFKVREKSGNFAKSQGKSQFLSKSVKSQGIFFFQVGARFCEDYENIFIRKIKL